MEPIRRDAWGYIAAVIIVVTLIILIIILNSNNNNNNNNSNIIHNSDGELMINLLWSLTDHSYSMFIPLYI